MPRVVGGEDLYLVAVLTEQFTQACTTSELRAAVQGGELTAEADIAQLVFELDGVALAARQSIQLRLDPSAAMRARHAIDRLLHRPETAPSRSRRRRG